MLRAEPGESWVFTLDRLDRISATAAGGEALLVRTPEEAIDAKRRGKLALVAALEGADGLEGEIEHLRELHRKGVSLVQLVHFRANEIGHIQTWPYSPGGLTDFGGKWSRGEPPGHRDRPRPRQRGDHPRRPRGVEPSVIFSHTGALAEESTAISATRRIRAIAGKAGSSVSGPTASRFPSFATWWTTSTT
jgi:hypothetical protein